MASSIPVEVSPPGSPTIAPVPGSSALTRDLFRGGLAGMVAGIVFLGLGSRVVMRISALLNPDMRGVLTDNGDIIGDITIGGTLGVMIFSGIFGGLAIGLFWVLVRDWLPSQLLVRAILTGLLAVLLGGAVVVSSANEDFHKLDPIEAHIVMFLALVFMAGVTTPFLDRRLETSVPMTKTAGDVYALVVALGGLFALLGTIFLFGGDTPLHTVGFFVLLAVVTVLGWQRYSATTSSASRLQPWLRFLALGAIAGLTISSALELIEEINALL